MSFSHNFVLFVFIGSACNNSYFTVISLSINTCVLGVIIVIWSHVFLCSFYHVVKPFSFNCMYQ